MDERQGFSFSFSDPDTGLHCFGYDAGACLLLRPGKAQVVAQGVLSESDGRYHARIADLVEAELDPLGGPIELDSGRHWQCALGGAARPGEPLGGFGSVAFAAPLVSPWRRRRLWACFGAELAFVLEASASRPIGGHGEEQVEACVARGEPLTGAAAQAPHLSSTYGADGALLRAGLELWEDDPTSAEEAVHDRYRALRLAGETVAAGRLDEHTAVAFVAWRFDARRGIGAYVIETAG